MKRFREIAKENVDFILIEIGGTVGDYENVLFLEAARQMRFEGESVIFVHVVYLPIVKTLGEMKTKAAQHSVRDLREIGIQPDFIICRAEKSLDDVRRKKLALFCNIKEEDVISDPDLKVPYELPIVFDEQRLCEKILKKFNLNKKRKDLKQWKEFIDKIKHAKKIVNVGIVGKYFDIGQFQLSDSYISVIEAIKHACWYYSAIPKIEWIDSKIFEKNKGKLNILKKFDGIIVPGGFGTSGVEGKITSLILACV
jgi:CTP synthase